MNYKCLNCGEIFNEHEISVTYEDYGMMTMGCPVCGETFEQAEQCPLCYCEFGKSELIGGVCKDCLDEAITVDNAERYFLEKGLFTDFMVSEFYGHEDFDVGNLNPCSVEEEDFRALYLMHQQSYKLFGKGKILDCVKKYINRNIDDFGDWIYERHWKEVIEREKEYFSDGVRVAGI